MVFCNTAASCPAFRISTLAWSSFIIPAAVSGRDAPSRGAGLIVSPARMTQRSLGTGQNVRARSVIRDCFLQGEHHTGGIPGLTTVAEGGKAGFDVGLAKGVRGEHANFFVGRRHGAFFQMADFFVELLARTRTGELDLDVFVRA